MASQHGREANQDVDHHPASVVTTSRTRCGDGATCNARGAASQKGTGPMVRGTLRAVPANWTCPLFRVPRAVAPSTCSAVSAWRDGSVGPGGRPPGSRTRSSRIRCTRRHGAAWPARRRPSGRPGPAWPERDASGRPGRSDRSEGRRSRRRVRRPRSEDRDAAGSLGHRRVEVAQREAHHRPAGDDSGRAVGQAAAEVDQFAVANSDRDEQVLWRGDAAARDGHDAMGQGRSRRTARAGRRRCRR